MNLENLTYFGSRQFFKGIIEVGARLGDWSYCIRLVATRLNMEMTIGGETLLIADGRTLLDTVVNAARAGKFTQEEANAIADQLDRISFLYSSMRTPFYVNAYKELPVVEEEIVQEIVEPVLTTPEEVAKIDVVEEESTIVEVPKEEEVSPVVEAAPAKRGRKSSK